MSIASFSKRFPGSANSLGMTSMKATYRNVPAASTQVELQYSLMLLIQTFDHEEGQGNVIDIIDELQD